MFDQQKSAPWYKSRKLLLALPIAVILVAGVWGFNTWRGSRTKEAQYDRLEQHRQQQAAEAPATAAATAIPVAQASASPSPVAGAPPPATASRNSWTNFRGARRDGKYDQNDLDIMAGERSARALETTGRHRLLVVCNCRRQGLHDRAATSSRKLSPLTTSRPAANSGQQAWNAEYNDSTGDGPRSTPTWDQGRLYVLGATGELQMPRCK